MKHRILDQLANGTRTEQQQAANQLKPTKQYKAINLNSPFRRYAHHCLPMLENFFWYIENFEALKPRTGKAVLINFDELEKIAGGERYFMLSKCVLPLAEHEDEIFYLSDLKTKRNNGTITDDEILKVWVKRGDIKEDHLTMLQKAGMATDDLLKIAKHF